MHNKPHFHTGNHQINFDKSGLLNAVRQLEFEPTSEMNKDSTPVRDPLAAIQFVAANFPFRPAVAKTVILLTCNKCGDETDYYDVQQALLERDIELHVFTTESIDTDVQEHEFDILGFNAKEMFTTAGVKSDLRASLASPHDSCTVLAQETDGSVWSLAEGQTSITSMPVEHIGGKLQTRIDSNECVTCECDNLQLAPRTVCFPCNVPTPVSLSGQSFFNMPYIKLTNTFRKATKTLGRVDQWII